MIGLSCLGHNQFECAKWYEKDKDQYKFIRVGVINENEKRFSSVIQNIMTQADSTMLFTSYRYPYKVGQHIFYRDKWWEIAAVGERTLDVNPQVMSLIKPQLNMQSVLELIEVDWV